MASAATVPTTDLGEATELEEIAPAPAPAPVAAPADSAAATSDEDDRSYLRAVAKGFAVGTVIWAALIFAIMYWVGDLGMSESLKWALWIGPWGGLFLGGTFTVGFWTQKHVH